MMEIVIKIPKEFEEHFKSDRFEDSLARVASDIESFGFQLAGRYEKETITMLREALKNGTPLPKGHGNLKDVDALYESSRLCHTEEDGTACVEWREINDAPTIIEADGGREDEN